MNNKRLLLILVGLLAAYALVQGLSGPDQRSFPDELVAVDTAAVTEMLLYPKAENQTEIRFARTDQGWTVQKDALTAEADANTVRALLGQLVQIRPERLAATREEKWTEFQVSDSTGTRVVAKAGRRNVADLMIGRASFQQGGRQTTSYVRKTDEDETYAVDGFLSLSFDRAFPNWRNRTFIRVNPNDLTRLAFTTPTGTFALTKPDSVWMVNDQPADSAGVAAYLNNLRFLSSTTFADEVTTPPANSTHRLVIEGNNMLPVSIQGFTRMDQGDFLLHSTLNPNVYFQSDSSGTFATVFVDPATFRGAN